MALRCAMNSHAPALSLEPPDSFSQLLLGATHGDGLEKLAVRNVRESVFVTVYPHEPLGTAVVGGNLVVGDRPVFEIQRAETQSMAGPAEGTSAKSLDQAVPGAVANRREMVLFVAVAPEIRDVASGEIRRAIRGRRSRFQRAAGARLPPGPP